MSAVLDPSRILEIFDDCRVQEADVESIRIEGVMHNADLSTANVSQFHAEIDRMLDDLPAEFHQDGGGGWSFLNACTDRRGHLWTGEHATVERLLMLGIAIGRVSYLMPRELWYSLPGGMPYILIRSKSVAE